MSDTQSKMSKLLTETLTEFMIEKQSLNPDGNANIINLFFTFEDELKKMVDLYERVDKIRAAENK